MALTLVIGNKNYSSWSMRPWLALKAAGIAFDEVQIPLYTGEADKQRILKFTPSGKVPALVDGDITVWDSLAIIEYAAEKFPALRDYMDTMLALPAFQEWTRAGLAETLVIEKFEVE